MINKIRKKITDMSYLQLFLYAETFSLLVFFIALSFYNFKLTLICLPCILLFCGLLFFSLNLLRYPKNNIEKQNIIDEDKKNVLQMLNYDSFLQLDLAKLSNENSCIHSDDFDMFLSIINYAECRFFAKLNYNDEIVLAIRNKDDKTVYINITKNYKSFNKRYVKFEETI